MSRSFHSAEWYRIAGAKPALRRDVSVLRHLYLGLPWYVLSDTTSGKVHRLTPAAHAVAGRLDGRQTLDEIWRDVVADLGDEAPGQDDVVTLVSQLHQSDLLTDASRPLLDDLVERKEKHGRAKVLKLVLNPLSATVPLIDPHRFLGWLAARLSVLPRALYWGAAAALILSALMILPAELPGLMDRGLDGLLDLENLLLIALIYPVVKALHEIAHGIAIRARGGAVHQMGLIFIAFYPIPYVEGTAAQAFPSKWSRAAVSAAGVAVELCIAALALFVWSAAEPGPVKSIAYNTLLISGVSTLLVNGNPLMKFDGYWVLSDLIEIPNLSKRGNAWWGQVLRRRLLGTHEPDSIPVSGWERTWFALYPPLAFVYRIGISLSIALFVAQTYRAVGVILAVWSLGLMLVWPALKTAHAALTDARIRQAGGRAVLGSGLAAVVLGGALLVPLPHFAVSQGVVWLPPEAIVRAASPGAIAEVAVQDGARIEAGDPLFVLDAPELAAERARLAAALARVRAERQAAYADRAAVRTLDAELLRAERALADADARLDDLTIRAAAPGRADMPAIGDSRGRFLRQGEVVGHILPESGRVVRAVVRQGDVELLRSGLRGVELRLAETAGERLSGRLLREVPAGSDSLPSAVLSVEGGGPFAATQDREGRYRTPERLFQVDLGFAEPPARAAPFGMRVFVRFEFEPTPLANRIARRVRLSFLSLFDT